jgi:hypothetical protein
MKRSTTTLLLALVIAAASVSIGLIWGPDLETGLASDRLKYYSALGYWSICPLFIYLTANLSLASAERDATYYRAVAGFVALGNYVSVTIYFFKYPFFFQGLGTFWTLSLLQLTAMTVLLGFAFITTSIAREQTSVQTMTSSRKLLIQQQLNDFASFLRKKTNHATKAEHVINQIHEETRLLPSFMTDSQFTTVTKKFDAYVKSEMENFVDFELSELSAAKKLDDLSTRTKVFLQNLQSLT